MAEDETIIVGSPDAHSVPGSERYSCSLCHGDAWIAPASQKLLRERNHKLICMICYLFDPKVEAPEEIGVSSRSELIAAFGSEEAADEAIRRGTKLMADAKKAKRVLQPWKRC